MAADVAALADVVDWWTVRTLVFTTICLVGLFCGCIEAGDGGDDKSLVIV